MCGIAGFIPLKDSEINLTAREKMLQNALSAMHHRGPDHQTIRAAGQYVFGHNRLSILDLTEKANQPMSDDSGRYWLTFNGEIFNYLTLRKELTGKGVIFNSNSDTEVLLQILIHEGEQGLNKLNGFFAFVFVDTLTNSGIIVRDRFGEKPLWYHQNDSGLVFASELKGLQELGIPTEIDPTSLSLLLQLSYIPAPHSIYKGIYKLMPGQLIHFGQEGISKKSWYQIPEKDKISDSANASVQLETLLEDAVKIRLQADVPVGCFLSGGVDSSIVAYLAKKHKSDLRTFSLGFPDVPYLDESNYANEVAKHLGTIHEVLNVTSIMMVEEAENIWGKLDEPFADSSAIAGHILAKKTREYVNVALSGDGADELFAGYNKHAALLRSMNASSGNTLLKGLSPLLKNLPTGRTGFIPNLIRKVSKFSEGLKLPLKERYLLWASFSEAEHLGSLVRNASSEEKTNRLDFYLNVIKENDFNSLLKADQKLVLPNDMLTKVDITSMANSLEVRPPFMDFHVVEFANRLDSELKINADQRKIILQKTFGKFLPDSVFTRRKQGFEVPLELWLQTWMKPLVIKYVESTDAKSAQYLNQNQVKAILDLFYSKGKNQHATLIYSMLVFSMWLEKQKI